MMRKFPNISKNLPNVQCFALESFAIFWESVANVFLPKEQVFEKFVWSLETTLRPNVERTSKTKRSMHV